MVPRLARERAGRGSRGGAGSGLAPAWGSGAAPSPAGAARIPVVVCAAPGEGGWAREDAAALGASHVVELPLGAPWLVSQLAPESGSSVLAVVGAVGGVGATTVAIACAVGRVADCLLVDADPDSPGLDLPLGIPEGAGVRWPEIPDTADPLDPGSLRSALPEVGGVTVVTGSRAGRGPACGGPGSPGVRAGGAASWVSGVRSSPARWSMPAGARSRGPARPR